VGRFRSRGKDQFLKFMHLRKVLKGLHVKLSERGKHENMKTWGRQAEGVIRGRGMIKCCSS